MIWQDRKTNEDVLRMVGQNRNLLTTVLERKKNWMGHVLRGNSMMRDVIEGRMEGKRGRGRKRIAMLDDLIDESYVELKRRAQDREGWKMWKPWTCREAEH